MDLHLFCKDPFSYPPEKAMTECDQSKKFMYIRCIPYVHKYFFPHVFDVHNSDDETMTSFPECFSLDDNSGDDALFST